MGLLRMDKLVVVDHSHICCPSQRACPSTALSRWSAIDVAASHHRPFPPPISRSSPLLPLRFPSLAHGPSHISSTTSPHSNRDPSNISNYYIQTPSEHRRPRRSGTGYSATHGTKDLATSRSKTEKMRRGRPDGEGKGRGEGKSHVVNECYFSIPIDNVSTPKC